MAYRTPHSAPHLPPPWISETGRQTGQPGQTYFSPVRSSPAASSNLSSKPLNFPNGRSRRRKQSSYGNLVPVQRAPTSLSPRMAFQSPLVRKFGQIVQNACPEPEGTAFDQPGRPRIVLQLVTAVNEQIRGVPLASDEVLSNGVNPLAFVSVRDAHRERVGADSDGPATARVISSTQCDRVLSRHEAIRGISREFTSGA